MPHFGNPADVIKNISRDAHTAITTAINRVGETVSDGLDAYLQVIYRWAWPIIGTLNRHGLHVRRYQMFTLLSHAIPAVISGALGYLFGRLCRRR